MINTQQYMDRIELFAGLDADSASRIAARFQTTRFEKDAFICREGDPGDKMFIITSGEVAVLKDMGWGKRELKKMGEGEVFGEMALLSNEPRSATIQAVTSVECLHLGLEAFSELLETEHCFARQVARILTRRIRTSDERQARELLKAYQTLMFAVASLADARDPETGAHLQRTRRYCALLSERLAAIPKYRDAVTPAFIESIYDVSPLHDIGKVAIPDGVLLKAGRLTDEEYTIMKTHTEAGARTLREVVERCDLEAFRMAYRICLHHHEKWDGTGYPGKLAGEAIPLEARIMAMADVYDALLSKRVYKAPMTCEATRAEIARSSGTFFDPEIAAVMLAHVGDFEAVHRQYQE